MSSEMNCCICGEVLPITDTSYTECPSCLKDYNDGNYKIRLPRELKYGLNSFDDYMKIGKLIRNLRSNLLTRKEFNEELAKLVEKINEAAEESKQPKSEEQKRDTAYAESFYIR